MATAMTALVLLLLLASTNALALPTGALTGIVACVTGATRGIGRGIALGLAEQGATVYITGRSLNNSVTTEKELGGSLESVAAEIASLGGVAVPLQVDHRVDEQVEEVFRRIEREQGRLDILVNNAFQVPSRPDGKEDKGLLFRPFWEQPGWFWDTFMTVGLRSHYVASCYAVPLMQKQAQAGAAAATVGAAAGTAGAGVGAGAGRRPLIVHVSSWGGTTYSFNVAYGVGKAGVDRMAADMHIEMAKAGLAINCVSIYPGIVRTERMSDMLDSGEWDERSQLATPKCFVESPQLTGRAIAALYADPAVPSGKVVVTAELARKYAILDPLTGITPPSIRSLKFLIPSVFLGKIAPRRREKWEKRLIRWSPDLYLPMFVMAEPRPE